MAKFNFKKDIERIVRTEMDDYVTKKCVPTTKKWIKRNCNKGYATGNLAGSVFYDRNGSKLGSLSYTIYVEAYDKYGTNYAKYVDQGRGEVKPVYAKALRWSDGTYHMRSAPAKAAHFIDDTVKELQH